MNKEEFRIALKELNIELTEEINSKLEIYKDFLMEYNTHTNLTAIKEENEIYLKHFYDSITILKAIDLNNINSVLDIGSGAGFPGVVLKIFYPNLNIVLVDSNGKKTKFLQELINKLELNNIEVINDRIENLYTKYINSFDLVTARAVTNMRVLSELSIPFAKVNGYFIAMKGSNREEIDEALDTINRLNAKIEEKIDFKLYKDDNDRCLVKIIKNEETDINSLRTYEQIIKNKH